MSDMAAEIVDLMRTGVTSFCVESGPGTGKSYLIRKVAAIDEQPVLVLAYNRMLKEHLEKTLPLNAECLTFHGLCGRYLAVARDDDQLCEAVEAVERGEATPRCEASVKYARVCIDEAQDVRSIYVRLLHACGVVSENTQFLVAGDRNQLIYDFDEEFPASLDLLEHPQKSLPIQTLQRAALTQSHRLSGAMCDMVNDIFATSLVSAKGEDGGPIDVRIPTTIWNCFQSVEDLFDKEKSLLLLTTERSPRPVCTFLSEASRKGHQVAVHHFDKDEGAGFQGLRAGTYWSAKGVEAECVVVLLSERSARNATYVALTRASRRLVLVLDPETPNAAVVAAMLKRPRNFRVSGPLHVLERAKGADLKAALTPKPRFKPFGPQNAARLRVTREDAKAAVIRSITVVAPAAPRFDEEGGACDAATISDALLRSIFFMAEHRDTKAVRWIGDLLNPVRMERSTSDQALLQGFVRRPIGLKMPLSKLLAPDLADAVRAIEARTVQTGTLSFVDAYVLALATFSFNAFDHTMRRYSDASDDVVELYTSDAEWALSALAQSALEYDTILVKGNFWIRFAAKNDDFCVLIAISMDSAIKTTAALHASMHPKRTCRVLELSARAVHDIVVENDSLLKNL